MDKLIIEGGVPLRGRIRVSGSKNAALPILMACLLAETPVRLSNVPRLRDIRTTLKLLNILGCESEFEENVVRAQVVQLKPEAPYDLVKTMRASVLCLGPLLALLGEARVALPGGCAIGARPVDLHLKALERMGATFELTSGYILGRCKKLKGAHITFDFPTVGGTENLLMAASLAEGETVLENAAREPEVADLANFLNACGARISGQGTSVIRVEGVSSLRGCDYRVMPDRIEAGTFLIAAPITGGELEILDCPFQELDALVYKLREMGVWVQEDGERVIVRRDGELTGVDVTTQPHPGFPTDMQAQIMALMCVARGAGSIQEKIFENRFMHVLELVRLGANIKLKDRTAVVRGVPKLVGAPVMASDLRASASLVLAGLAAEGVTEVQRIYHLDRGYENIEAKLSAVGARIRRAPE
ncbi:MAG TPA: UDP-N-acetylglucosamine 1-carboxyvinyltransferase [Desulfovibrio sp.]|jgi:UDP-N-acetylglucosamine 1-carboxyvinyltransferase|uniref:UDP-N-acetylglucosamine 1-carboxyvinyltransferase n=1 Tax=Desulfovibrio TaxID=872 RepID=UPI00041958F3|nr:MULTISPECIES: UDP-N-acetylglucosamine 1-carboxyvinyltransferase [Desulfovibrio]MDY0306878.1 UDP-N-acetylglucosamine 1-carboxyvinyltransferase [Desulfovibrionaceae bacterium]HMM37189.1 UDP-N-acetylglucosamine 1-carboxyvinyltransferase [Desulfovibrio sp.]